MESGKLNNSSSSGDQQEKSSDDEARIGRSYDCNFCKRGFTNAQALGGHMNIHRKDKAKANKRNSKEPSSPNQLPHIPIAQTTYYQVYLPSPTYYYQQGYNNNPFDYQAPWTGHGSRVIDEDHHGGLNNNLLSLNFGTPSHVHQFGERRNDIIEDDSEVDLELRLGNHHW
ncbi:hypothetical protein Leryth_006324 [Lithospermum erythrorhizon]|uniref:C2H2-type domain-containing protein n=1 Tax=Lithospermum erythrorhizon TaxID=34254 RepID=A0AAV3RYI2_LITER|nr:hypothetical protein Leryth_006324 [Lithospermum erythrorhizon]